MRTVSAPPFAVTTGESEYVAAIGPGDEPGAELSEAVAVLPSSPPFIGQRALSRATDVSPRVRVNLRSYSAEPVGTAARMGRPTCVLPASTHLVLSRAEAVARRAREDQLVALYERKLSLAMERVESFATSGRAVPEPSGDGASYATQRLRAAIDDYKWTLEAAVQEGFDAQSFSVRIRQIVEARRLAGLAFDYQPGPQLPPMAHRGGSAPGAPTSRVSPSISCRRDPLSIPGSAGNPAPSPTIFAEARAGGQSFPESLASTSSMTLGQQRLGWLYRGGWFAALLLEPGGEFIFFIK